MLVERGEPLVDTGRKNVGRGMAFSAMLLTAAHLCLRMVGMGFQVYLSGRVGPEGMGLMQLVLSVTALLMTAAMAGIRTGTMYLAAEAIGKGRAGDVSRILRACFLYSGLFSLGVSLGTLRWAQTLAVRWVGRSEAALALRAFAVLLPAVCWNGVMTGYFTAAGRIRALTVVEVLEQFIAMALTMGLLRWAGTDPGRTCAAVVAGSSLSSGFTLGCLLVLRGREARLPAERPGPVGRKLLRTALPLAVADDLRMGLSTVEHLMIPRRLSLYPGEKAPLARYGIVCGMVFPVLMFPAALLFGLTELLIPELARCLAGERRGRIRYLARRGLRVGLLYGLGCGGALLLGAEDLGRLLYGSAEAGRYLRLFAPLAPMLYLDILTDAMTKGLGQQVACVRYNIATSLLDVALLWFLLPRMGILGYFIGFVLSHAVNFALSLRRLLRTAELRIALRLPLAAGAGAVGAAALCRRLPLGGLGRAAVYAVLFAGACWVLTPGGQRYVRWRTVENGTDL